MSTVLRHCGDEASCNLLAASLNGCILLQEIGSKYGLDDFEKITQEGIVDQVFVAYPLVTFSCCWRQYTMQSYLPL